MKDRERKKKDERDVLVEKKGNRRGQLFREGKIRNIRPLWEQTHRRDKGDSMSVGEHPAKVKNRGGLTRGFAVNVKNY